VCTEAHLVALQRREEQAHVADDAPGQLRQVGAVLVCGAAAQRNLQDLGGAHAEPAGRAVRQARPAARLLVSWCSSLSSLNMSFRMFWYSNR